MIDREGDMQVLEALKSAGSDLTKPAHTVHYLCFKSREDAQFAADELAAEGYVNICVDRAAAPSSIWKRLFARPSYVCIAEKYMVPSEEEVFRTTDRMNSLAHKLGGEYDGWEASVE